MSINVKETLIETKRILRQRGRGRVQLFNTATGCPCLLGAVGLAAGVPERELTPVLAPYAVFEEGGVARPAVEALIDALPEDFTWPRGDIAQVYSFNDRQEQDEPVFDLIDKAIEAAA